MAAKTSIKPYKLQPSGDSLTRDDLATWREVLLSYMRQNDSWKVFLPGGSTDYVTWKAEDSGEAQVKSDNVTAWPDEVKTAFPDFLTCLATFAPAGCGETIKRESTSFTWAIDLIKETFGLKTRGEHFLALDDIKFDFSGSFTYQQAYMEVKDFICAGLLSVGDRCENKALTIKETLTPVAKNFITKEWLIKIDPRLPKHIRDTRGHLFTADKPTLACNQKIICEQIPTMLAELDGKTETGGSVNMNYVPAGRRGARPPRGRGLLRGAGSFRGYTQPRAVALPPARAQPQPQYLSGCRRCLEAIPARYDAAKTHATRDCRWPPNETQNSQPRPNFRVVLVSEDSYESASGDSYYQDYESQFYNDPVFEDVTQYDDPNENKDSTNYFSPSISHLSFSHVKI